MYSACCCSASVAYARIACLEVEAAVDRDIDCLHTEEADLIALLMIGELDCKAESIAGNLEI